MSYADFIKWAKNGDHPFDGHPSKEGGVVRYFRHPCFDGDELCTLCGRRYHDHGWIDQAKIGTTVCPGSVVSVYPIDGLYIVKKPPIEPIEMRV